MVVENSHNGAYLAIQAVLVDDPELFWALLKPLQVSAVVLGYGHEELERRSARACLGSRRESAPWS